MAEQKGESAGGSKESACSWTKTLVMTEMGVEERLK